MKKLLILVLLIPAMAFAADTVKPSKIQTSGANVHIGKGVLHGISFEPLSGDLIYAILFDSTTQNNPANYPDTSDGRWEGAIYPTSGGAVQMTRRYIVATATDIWFDTPIEYYNGLYMYLEYEAAYSRASSIRYILYFDPK